MLRSEILLHIRFIKSSYIKIQSNYKYHKLSRLITRLSYNILNLQTYKIYRRLYVSHVIALYILLYVMYMLTIICYERISSKINCICA